MAESAKVVRLLERAAAAVPDGLACYDARRGRLIPLGDGLVGLLGYAPAYLEGLDSPGLAALVHEEDRPRLERLVRQVAMLRDGAAAGESLRVRHADGHWCRLRLQAAVLSRNGNHRPALVLASLAATTGAAARPPPADQEGGELGTLLSHLLENVPESLTVTGGPPEFNVVAQTRRARELFGRELAHITELPAGDPARPYGVYQPDGLGAPSVEALPVYRATRFGEPVAGEEWVVRRPDGSSVAVEVDAVPVRAGDRVVGAVSSWRDVSWRKSLEEALRERAEQLALVIRTTQACWWSHEIATGAFTWSDECCQLFAWTQGRQASREDFLAVVHPRDRPTVAAALEAALQECSGFDLEFRILLPDGLERALSASVECHCDDAGKPVRFFGVLVDVSARERADTALRESEERFRQLAQTIDDVFWVADPARRTWLYLSPAYTRLFGAGDAEPTPQSWLEAVHPAERARVAKVFAGDVAGEGFDQEYRVRTARGLRWVRDRGIVSRDGAGRVNRILGVTEDITERRGRPSQLVAVQGRGAPGGRGELAPARDSIAREMDRLWRLAERIGDVASRGTHLMPAVPVDCAQVVGQAVERARPRLEERGVGLDVAADDRPMPLFGDPAQLAWAVERLLEHVSSWSAAGSRIEVRARPRNGVAVVEVGQGGGGLSRETLEGLLDAMVRRDAGDEDPESHRAARELALVRQATESHGGTLAAESASESYALVLRLPLAGEPPAGDLPPTGNGQGP